MNANPGTLDTGLRVDSIRTVLLSATYPRGDELRWVGGTIWSWDAALVEVTLEDGTTGVGEAGAGIMAAQAVPGIATAFEPYLLDVDFAHPLDVARHLRAYTAFWSRGGILSGVAGAIETACLDAVAKRNSVPAYDLLGGARRTSIETYASGGLGTTFEQITDWMLRQAEQGFPTVKFRAMTDPDTTLRLLDHVTARMPDGLRFVLDAVQGCASTPWPVVDAIRVGREVGARGARWYEEPCFADDLEGYARVRAELDVPISGVESNGAVREFAELVGRGCIDIAQPDVSFVGGPKAFSEVASIANNAGLSCVPHVWGSGVTFAANLHTVLAEPAVELFEYCTLPNPLRDALLVEPPALTAGRLHAPTGPVGSVSHSRQNSSSVLRSFRGVGMSSDDRPTFAALPGDDVLTSAMLSDSLDVLGLRHHVLEERLAPLVPGSRVLGRAWTVRFEPSDDDSSSDPYGAAIDYISAIRGGELAVIATDRSNDSAVWGELFSAAAIGAGAVGVVTDGNLRDTAKISGLGFPAFGRSRRPLDYRARMRVSEVGGVVRLGGVEIAAGDLVLADDDGVVVIPKIVEADVLELARERALTESTVLQELLAGDTLRTVWDRHGVL